MDVTAAVIIHLKADPRLLAKVAGGIAFRADLLPFPQLPAIKVQKISELRGNHSSTSRYSAARIQVSCYSKTDTEADEISEMVADRLDAKVNTIMGGLSIISCFDAGMTPDSNPKIPLYVYHRDFRIIYQVRIY